MREDVRPFLLPDKMPAFFAELIGISYCDGSYRIQRKNSPLCVAEYVVEGTGTLVVNGQSYTASAGDIYILEPGTDHTYTSDGDRPWTKLFINARGPLITSLLKLYELEGRVVFPQCPVEMLFRELFELAGGDLPQERLMELCALKFHEIVIGVSASLHKATTVPSEAIQLKNRIDGRMDTMLSIRELADSIYRSPDYVIKLFKYHYGQTPHAYATRRKVMAAQQLLRETWMAVGEIAASLGFSDAQYFSHVFRRHTGCSPTEYRHRYTRNHDDSSPPV